MKDLVATKFAHSGQTCVAPKRILVHRSIYGEFLARFEERVRNLVTGAPEDVRTDVSPVASAPAVARIREQLKEAVAMGAKAHKYGLRAALFGGKEAAEAATELVGKPYCHPVPAYTFGKFGTIALNQTRR